VQSFCKTVWKFLKKLKIEAPHHPADLLLDIQPKRMKSLAYKDIRTLIFIAPLSTIVKMRKQLKPSETGE
jgi:hypothetical protein